MLKMLIITTNDHISQDFGRAANHCAAIATAALLVNVWRLYSGFQALIGRCGFLDFVS